MKLMASPKSRSFNPVATASSGANKLNVANPIPAANCVQEDAIRTGIARDDPNIAYLYREDAAGSPKKGLGRFYITQMIDGLA